MITLKQLKSKLEKDFGWENLESDDNKWFVDNLLKDTIQAIEVIRCCESDSEQLPNMRLEQAIEKAKPNMDKIKDVDKHIDNIR